MKILKKYSFHNKHIYSYGLQTLWSFMKFYFVHIVKVCFVFQKHYAYTYIPPHMHKTLSTLGKEKKQKEIKFYKKLRGKFIFSRVTIKSQNVLFQSSTQKVRLHHHMHIMCIVITMHAICEDLKTYTKNGKDYLQLQEATKFSLT